MQMVLVENKMARPFSFPVVLQDNPRVQELRVLWPGVDEIDAAEFEKSTKKSKVVATLVKEDKLVIHGKHDGEGKALAGLKPGEARKIIASTFKPKLLALWQANETRTDVVKALIERESQLKAEFAKKPAQDE